MEIEPPTFPEFAWCVPHAFSDALGLCRFEQGDTFYDSKAGYLVWSEALKHLDHSIQIEEPKASDKTALKEEDAVVFSRNWSNPLLLSLISYKDGKKEQIRTSQGRLYTFLWRGDRSIFDPSKTAPSIPVLVGAANKLLEEISRSHFKKLCEGMEKPNVFLMAVDPTNSISRLKVSSIRTALKGEFGVREEIFKAPEIGLNIPELAPTVSFIAFAVDSTRTEAVRDCLKKQLYKPSKNRKTEADRFRLRTHGLFLTPKDKPKVEGQVMISFAHGEGRYFRFRFESERVKKSSPLLWEFVQSVVEGDCPNHLFKEPPYASSQHFQITPKPTRNRTHPIIDLADRALSTEGKYKSNHENLEKYFLDNDASTFAVEVPLWIEADEFPNYKKLFPDGGVLTGHIDILRHEADGKIWIWDFKPAAYNERYAAAQLYCYALMLSVRTGIPLSEIRCGYFDASDAFEFNPAELTIIEPQPVLEFM